MLDFFNILFSQFVEFSKQNPVVAGILGLWGATLVTLVLQTVPLQIFLFFKRQFTTTLVLNSMDRAYFDFLNWLSSNKMHSFVRTLNVNNQHGGWGKTSKLTIGYGTTFFVFQRHIFFMSRTESSQNHTSTMKEQLSITVIGRNQKIFESLLAMVKRKDWEDKSRIRVNEWNGDSWQEASRQYKRNLDTVIIPKETKARLKHAIESFHSDKQWYLQNGVPWRLGMLFQGPPGTGKTSLIKAICSEYNKRLYYLSLQGISDKNLQKALSTVPEGGIVAIEDIDAFEVKLDRDSTSSAIAKDPLQSLTLSGTLNAIDGVLSAEGIIVIATTNHPDKLDAALLREGRLGLHLTLGYMGTTELQEYMNRFYPVVQIPNSRRVKAGLAPCDVQRLIFDNKENPQKVLEATTDVVLVCPLHNKEGCACG